MSEDPPLELVEVNPGGAAAEVEGKDGLTRPRGGLIA
jgi:hypothetical protein